MRARSSGRSLVLPPTHLTTGVGTDSRSAGRRTRRARGNERTAMRAIVESAERGVDFSAAAGRSLCGAGAGAAGFVIQFDKRASGVRTADDRRDGSAGSRSKRGGTPVDTDRTPITA